MDSNELTQLALGSIPDALKLLMGKKEVVTVHLKGGQSVTGTVTQVSAQLVHLAELVPNRQFYDALVSLSEIAGFEVRVRTK